MSDLESLRNANADDIVPDALLVMPPDMFSNAAEIASVLEAAGVHCAPVPDASVDAPEVRMHGHIFPYPGALGSLLLIVRTGEDLPKAQ